MSTGSPVRGFLPARGAAADGELPEPRDGHRIAAREGIDDGGEHGSDHALGRSVGRRRLGSDVGG